MMNINENAIDFIHNSLNDVYSLAEKVFETIKSEGDFKASYGYFSGNYIKINGKYEYQKYPIPVISIEDKGDIGFNIDGVWFEFFLHKNEFHKINIEGLIRKYKVEIYGGNDCLVDFYYEGKSAAEIIEGVKNSKEKAIGIAIYLNAMKYIDIKESFIDVCSLLNI